MSNQRVCKVVSCELAVWHYKGETCPYNSELNKIPVFQPSTSPFARAQHLPVSDACTVPSLIAALAVGSVSTGICDEVGTGTLSGT